MDISGLPSDPVTYAALRGLGLSRTHIRRAESSGALHRPLHGVYVRGDVRLSTEVRLAAAVLVISPHAVACDRTAAWIWGVDTFQYRELDDVPPLETYVLRGRHRTSRRDHRGGVRDLQPQDWVEVNGVKVTTPLRTALDLGCSLNRREALAAMDALMRCHGFTHRDLRRVLPRYRRRRGVVQLRELIPVVDPRAESPRESWMRLAIHDAGLLAPTSQWWIDVDGVPTYRLDLAYPHARIAVEYDGSEHHTRHEDRARDEQRRTWLRAHGWTVIVIAADAFAPDADDEWLDVLREALRVARRPVRRSYVR
jgi:hypothetical protein